MKTKLKKVYYCDYCKKHGLRKDYMKYHEEHCTLNLKRKCGLCKRIDSIEPIINKYKNINRIEDLVNVPKQSINIDKLKEDVDYCPVCALTVIRCAELKNVNFDYKKEVDSWWDNVNNENYNYRKLHARAYDFIYAKYGEKGILELLQWFKKNYIK